MFHATLITMSRKYFFGFFLEISFSDRKFSKSKYFKSFSGNYSCSCFMLPWSLWAENIFFDFRSSQLPFDIRFWTRGFPLKMQSQKAGLPFATRARKRELSIQEVRIENDLDRKFSKSKFFKVFLKTTFLHDSCYPVHYKPKFCLKIGKNENFDYKINENCPIGITKIGKKWKFWLRNQRPNPPP